MLEPTAQVGCEPVECSSIKSIGGLQPFAGMLWSTLSKAADKSKSVSTARSPESSAVRISASTLRSVVSVE